MGLREVGGGAPLPARALVGFHEGQGSRELLGQKADGNNMYALRLPGLKVVADSDDDGIDDIQPGLLLDLPNGCVIEGLPWLKIASRNRIIWGMGAFPFADQDLALGVDQDDADADMGAGAGLGGHDGVSLVRG